MYIFVAYTKTTFRCFRNSKFVVYHLINNKNIDIGILYLIDFALKLFNEREEGK